jgi:hypothetical protein
LTSLSNKILQNILSDIEHFHKRYPLITNSSVTNNDGDRNGNSNDNSNGNNNNSNNNSNISTNINTVTGNEDESSPIRRTTSLKFKTTLPTYKINKPSKLAIEVTNDQDNSVSSSTPQNYTQTQNDESSSNKKKYTEDSVAIHNLVLQLQRILNELCLARMLTNDYGRLYFQELDKASHKEAEKFLHEQKPSTTTITTTSINNEEKISRSLSKSKSKSKPKSKPIQKTSPPETNQSTSTVSREIPIRNSSLARGGSLKDNKFIKSLLKNMFKDEDEDQAIQKSNSLPSRSFSSFPQDQQPQPQPQVQPQPSQSSSDPITEEQKISEITERSIENDITLSSSSKNKEEKKTNHFMNFFKFKLNKSSRAKEEIDNEKEKEKEDDKDEEKD